MALVNEHTKLPLGFVITLVAGAIALASAAAVANFRVGDTAAKVEAHDKQINDHSVELGKSSTILESLSKTVERIDRNVERMSRHREDGR